MHYYQFNIGDYSSHTSRLSPIEDLAYRRLLDLYYLNERPLNGCSADVARDIGLSEYPAEVDFVLSKYFVKTDENWVNNRAESEIKAYKLKLAGASKAGKASGKARRNKASERPLNKRSSNVERPLNGNGTTVEPNKDVEPTNNHKPITNNQLVKEMSPDGDLFEDFWKSWPDGYGPKGSKQEACSQFTKLGITPETLITLKEAAVSQAKEKSAKKAKGEFAENFPHVCRWLKNKRWEDEAEVGQIENFEQDFIRKHSDTSWVD